MMTDILLQVPVFIGLAAGLLSTYLIIMATVIFYRKHKK